MNKGTGLIVLEVRNSNPNGDPDRDGEPRTRNNGIGEITGVSLKRKMRDLVAFKEGPVWESLEKEFQLDPKSFEILESRDRDRSTIKNLTTEDLLTKYWDARVFGCTFLEEKANHVKSGVLQVGLGESIAPVEIRLMTLTNKAGVQEGKDRGMAPLGFKAVQHGVYIIPFHVNPTYAKVSNCSKKDIEIALKTMALAYSHTASATRCDVYIKHLWYAEHKTPLGSCRPEAIIDELKPTKNEDPSEPSSSIAEYTIPKKLSEELVNKLNSIKDYVQ